jgi:transcriptional regulator with XRE-family HTH domain
MRRTIRSTLHSMTNKEKQLIRARLGYAIHSILKENANSKKGNVTDSIRSLAASSGVEYSIIQRITSGKKNPQFTTVIALADGLGLSFSEFASYFDKTVDQSAVKYLAEQKKKTKKSK